MRMSFIVSRMSSLPILSVILFILGLFLLYSRMLDVNMKEKMSSKGRDFLIKRLRKDELLARRNEQLEKIGKGVTGWRRVYRDLIQNVIISLNLPGVSVENFTTLFVFMGVVFWVGYAVFFDSVFLGLAVAVPTVFALAAFIVSYTKTSVRANDNRVMDSLDLICPTIEASVISAIKKNMDGYDLKIRPHYQRFLDDIEAHGLLFREAIVELNKRLGPRFDDFAQKALIFHETGDEGMNEMFMDIPEMNNFVRSINRKSDKLFQEKNTQMVSSSALVIGFLVYSYTNPLTGDVMRNTVIGKLVGAVSIAMIIMMYAIFQVAQATIDYNKIKED